MGGGVLVGQDVDSRLGGVGDAAEVVVVEVGEHDVAHILGAEAEAPELGDGGHLGLEARAGGGLKSPGHHPPGVGQIGETGARVDEDEALVGLHGEDMAHRGKGR